MLFNMKLVALLALMPLLSWAAGLADYLEINPDAITVPDSTFKNKQITFKLKKQPNGPVFLSFVGNDLLSLSDCSLAFDSFNFNEEQSILVSSTLLSRTGQFSGDGVALKLTVTAESDPELDCQTQDIIIKSDDIFSGKCRSTGDPHFSTFDSRIHHFQGIGFYYLMQSKDLTIQTEQFYWTTRSNGQVISVNRNVAIRYKDSLAIFDLKSVLATQQLAIFGDNTKLSYVQSGSNKYLITTDDGSRIEISHSTRHANIWVTVSNKYYGLVDGLCGNFDGNAANDVNDTSAYAPSLIKYAVPSAENLFTNQLSAESVYPVPLTNVSDQFKSCPDNGVCKGEEWTNPSGANDGSGASGINVDEQTSSFFDASAQQPDPNSREVAEKVCSETFANNECGEIDNDFFQVSCVIDSVLLKDVAGTVEEYRQQFLRECRNHADELSNSTLKKDLIAAFEIQSTYGFSGLSYSGTGDFFSAVKNLPADADNSVEADPNVGPAITCKNGGQISDSGCLCPYGWAGIDCGVDISDIEQKVASKTNYDVKSQSGAGMSAASTLIGTFGAVAAAMVLVA